MPTDEQLRRLVDLSENLLWDPNLSPTRINYRPLITDPLVENMRLKLMAHAGSLTDLIGCVTHYHGVDGVDYRPITIDQGKMIRDHLLRSPNINPLIRQFRHLVIGVVRRSEDRPYDVTSPQAVCIGLY